jgi:hypothetical protein
VTVNVYCRTCNQAGVWELPETEADALAECLFQMSSPDADRPGPCGASPVRVVGVSDGQDTSFSVVHSAPDRKTEVQPQ